MSAPRKVLIIDDNADSRFLLTKTLLRKFPTALLIECADEVTALSVAAQENVHAIVLHRTHNRSGLELLPLLRDVAPALPIVFVSGIDRSKEAQLAGANYFLPYDEWLRIGTVVATLWALGELSDPAIAPAKEDSDPLTA